MLCVDFPSLYVSCLLSFSVCYHLFYIVIFIFSVTSCRKYSETQTCWQWTLLRIKLLLTSNSIILCNLKWIRSLLWSFRIALFIQKYIVFIYLNIYYLYWTYIEYIQFNKFLRKYLGNNDILWLLKIKDESYTTVSYIIE